MNEAELKDKTRDTARTLFHTLKGGTGQVLQGTAPNQINLSLTNPGTLTIKSNGGATLGNVVSSGSIKNLSAPGVALGGTIAVDGTIGKMTLGSVIGTIAASGAINSLAATSLTGAHVLSGATLGADNVGATRQEVAEVIFQQVTYGGMPVVVEALDVYAKVLGERGEPFPAEESSGR